MRKTLFMLLMAGCALTTQGQSQLPYQNAQLSAHERAVDLCSRLTLDEKAKLMLDVSPAIPRLGIKAFNWWSEALHGVANQKNVTVFPEPIGMAASFNTDMVYDVFTATSDEARAKYNEQTKNGIENTRFHSLSFWTPNVNIFRDPRWGRGQETYGEDPFLTSQMGIAVVKGLQGPEDTKYRKLYACAKHYAVHSGPEWSRHTANINDVSMRDLSETYLPAFKALVQEAQVREVMCAYQRLDDEPCCGNARLLQQILRDEWGFKYMIVSDCGAITDFHTSHKTSSDAAHAAAKGVVAGTDVECGFDYAYLKIPEAVAKGLITEKEIDKHVVRLLEGRFELGEMDDPSLVSWSNIPPSVLNSKKHQQLALDMARQTIVLLQNKDNLLPLSKNQKIAVIGPNADDARMMWGNYNGVPNHTITILEGISTVAGKKNVRYFKGCDLVDNKVLNSLLSQCDFNGKKGILATFWNNVGQEGRPVATEYFTDPINVTTSGQHTFANNVNMENFSARYETMFNPKESGEVVVVVKYTGKVELNIDNKKSFEDNTWRNTEKRIPLQVEKGKSYHLVLNYTYTPTYDSDLSINIGTESLIDYQHIANQLKGIETVIFAGGISSQLEGEEMPVAIDGFKGGDRTHIELPAVQRELLKYLKAAGKKIVFINCSGSAIALTPETQSCDAIVQAWYAGEKGGQAIADIIYGRVNPSAKLPVTFYRDSNQLPDFEDYSMKGRTYRYMDDPLFPFGYGLSYTQFSIGEAKLSAGSMKADGQISIQIPVTNLGNKEGTEVVQIYIRDVNDATGPLKSLKAFRRVHLKPGETSVETIPLTAKSFNLFDTDTNTMRTKAGHYLIYYGNSSAQKDLKEIPFSITE